MSLQHLAEAVQRNLQAVGQHQVQMRRRSETWQLEVHVGKQPLTDYPVKSVQRISKQGMCKVLCDGEMAGQEPGLQPAGPLSDADRRLSDQQ